MPRRGLSPDWRTMNRQTEELYRNLLGESIDARRLIRDCSAAEKQLALLVRVLSRHARLVILDEPTTALTPPEVAKLFGIIRRLSSQGITFIFISHMLEELTELSDTITVLRDGRNEGSLGQERVRPAEALGDDRRAGPLPTAGRRRASAAGGASWRSGDFEPARRVPGRLLRLAAGRGTGAGRAAGIRAPPRWPGPCSAPRRRGPARS